MARVNVTVVNQSEARLIVIAIEECNNFQKCKYVNIIVFKYLSYI